jgi:hypothetical protein
MNPDLSKRDLSALEVLGRSPDQFLALGQFPRGVGRGTLLRLTHLGLASQGISPLFRNQIGWRISKEGVQHLCLTGLNPQLVAA